VAARAADRAEADTAAASPNGASESGPRYVINEIPHTRWPKGIPPVMGAHLMPSGVVAPISTSGGAGVGNVPHEFQYHTEVTDAGIVQFVHFAGAAQGLVAQVTDASRAAIAERGAFTVAVSGGSMIKALAEFATAPDIDFAKWWVFYVDERNVPHSSDDSTHKGVQAGFLSKVPIPAAQVFAIHEGLPVDRAAVNYEGRMVGVSPAVLPRNAAGFPVFDCMLLGTGPDAHIASLFPNSEHLAEKKAWVLPVSVSPKPPPERITMTLPVINAAKLCLFLATGAGKAEIVQRILECQALPGAMPAQLVRPANGKVIWLLDIESSENLRIPQWENSKLFPRTEI